jgi:hypothetical protein
MLTVYLDSQDFSHFSTRHKDHSKYSSLKAELLQLKNDGHVRFVFSDVHVYEVFPKNASATAEGLDRIRTIAEFCGSESMPSFVSLIEYEVRSHISQSRGGELPEISSNWFPDLGIADTPMERASSPPNRKERRTMGSQVRKNSSPLVAEFRKKYPFFKDSNVLIRYYGHDVEWNDVVAMIESSVQDIKSFATWLASADDVGLNLPGILRGGYVSYVAAITAIREEVASRVADIEGAEQRIELAKAIGNGLDKSLSDLRSSIARRLMDELREYEGSVIVDDSMPSFDALLRYLAELVRRSSQLSTPRKPMGSDFADALHVSYLPRVDIFRTDAAAANALSHIFPARKNDIVADVFRLPALIRAKGGAESR